MGDNISSKLDIQLKPELSQIALITLLLISGISFFVSFYFTWYDKNSTLPLLVALLSLALVSLGWWKSQRAIDMANSSPTEIVCPDGSRLLTDTRAIESTNSVKQLASIIETMSVRQPLPEASGLIDTEGKVIQNSELKSNQIVDSINLKISGFIKTMEENLIKQQEEKANAIQEIPIDEKLSKHSGITNK